MQAASKNSIVVFAELVWTPRGIVCTQDCAHRTGQASFVDVYYLLVWGSIDDLIWSSILGKLMNVGQVASQLCASCMSDEIVQYQAAAGISGP